LFCFLISFYFPDNVYAKGPLVWSKCKRIRKGQDFNLPVELKTAIFKIPENEKVFLEGRLIWEWTPYKMCTSRNEHITLYGAALIPAEDCGVSQVSPIGLLGIIKDDAFLSQAVDKNLTPIKVRALESDGAQSILYHSYVSAKKQSYLRIINSTGEVKDGLQRIGKHNFTLQDIDGDSVYEVSGYGISELTTFCPLRDAAEEKREMERLKAIADQLGINRLTPGFDKKTQGIYKIFLLKKEGNLEEVRGDKYKHLFIAEAKKRLQEFNDCHETDRRRLANIAAAYLGILQGIGNEKDTFTMHDLLPEKLKNFNPALLAEYWQLQGYPFVKEGTD